MDVLLLLVCTLGIFSVSAECLAEYEGDGTCDYACMTLLHSFDTGAQAQSDCIDTCHLHCSASLLSNSVCDRDCNTLDCQWDSGDCLYCAEGCLVGMLGDGVCEEACDTGECVWDFGDCCTEANPTQIYVGTEGQQGNGSLADPFNDLSKLLLDLFLPYTRVILLPGSHLLRTDTLVSSSLLAQRSLISTYIAGDTHELSMIRLTRNFTEFRLYHAVTFSNVYFDGSFDIREGCWAPTCLYCPFTAFDINIEEWVNDRGELIDISQYATQSFCNEYHDKAFITVASTASVLFQTVTFANFNQQLNALLAIECGNVHLRNVTFYKCMAAPTGLTGGLIQQTCPPANAPYDCGELTYEGGSVAYLNDGYEYRPDIVLTGFMNIGGIRLLTLANVTFSYNNVMIGEDISAKGQFSSALLYVSNFRQITVTGCLFTSTVAHIAAAIYIDSFLFFPLKIVNGTASEELLEHIVIRDSDFSDNAAIAGSVLYIHHRGDNRNMRLEGLNFRGNACLMDVINIVSDSIQKEDLQGTNMTTEGVAYFVPSRRVIIAGITARGNRCNSVISVLNIGNLAINSVQIDDNGEEILGLVDLRTAFIRLSQNPIVYATKIPTFSAVLSCSAVISLNNVLNASFVHSAMDGNSCPKAVSGLYIAGPTLRFEFHDNVFTHGLGIAGIRVLISAPMLIYNMTCNDNFNRDNRHAVCLDMHMTAPTNIEIHSSEFLSNIGWFGTVAYFELTKSLKISHIFVYANHALYTSGGVLFNPYPTGPSQIEIKDSRFVRNSASSYGVVTVLDHDGLLAGNMKAVVDFKIENCEFQDNTSGNLGAGVSISTFITASPTSLIHNCTFLSNQSGEGAGLLIQFQAGVLTVSCSLFRDNRSPRGAAMFLNHYPPSSVESAVRVTHCDFRNQTGGPALVVQGYATNSIVYSDRNIIEFGDGGWKVTATTLADDSSTYISLTAREGPVLSGQSNTLLTLRNITGRRNQAETRGGGFFLTSHSELRMEGCDMRNNSAQDSGGVVYVDEDSMVDMRGSEFWDNRAGIASVMYAAPADVAIVNCTFSRNFVSNYAVIQLTHCAATIAFSRFINNLSNGLCPGLVFSSCTVVITDSEMSDQQGRNGGFIQGIDHNSIAIVRTSFRGGRASLQGGAVFGTLQSNFNVSLCLFVDCFCSLEGGAFSIQSSDLTITDSVFSNTTSTSNGGAISIREGSLSLFNSSFQHISPEIVYIASGPQLQACNCTFYNGSSNEGAAMIVKNVPLAVIESCLFVENSAEISGGGVLLLSDGSDTSRDQHYLVGNRFRGNRGKAGDGGGVSASGVDLYLKGNWFEGNTAGRKGGGLAVSCEDWDWCNVTVIDNEFNGNRGDMEGGGVAWSGTFPMFENNSFGNNSSPYGPEVASFPIEILPLSFDFTPLPYLSAYRSLPVALRLSSIASGQAYSLPIFFGLFDHNKVCYNTSAQMGARLTVLNSTAMSLSGNTDTFSMQCKFSFIDFVPIGEPGTTQFLVVNTDGVDLKKHAKVRDEAEYHDRVAIEVQFRMCVSGESQQNNVCFLCNSGTYSLDPSLPCLLCPNQAICYGNNTMVPKPGFWRISNDTDKFIECLAPEACIGSPEPPFLVLMGLCATGYTGNLCQKCIENYSRTGKFLCGLCPSQASNIGLTILILTFSLVLLALIVMTAIKSAMRPQSLIAIYVKIFMNYLQMVVVSASLNLNWPSFAKTFLNGQQMVGGVAEQLFSFDCLLQDASIQNEDLYFAKIQMFAFLPLLLLTLAALAWGTLAVCMKADSILRKLVASAVIIVFVLHPSTTKMMFSMFACMDLGDGQLWLINDLSIVCWNSDHIKQILMVVVPTMTIFIFGLPLLALFALVRKRALLESSSIKLMLCFLYKGYNRPHFYWEFVILYRKVAMIAASVFLAPVSIRMQALTVLALLLFALFLQVQTRPFFDSSLNRLEVKSILVSALTIYSGLYYETEELSTWLKIFLFCIMLTANAYFLASWVRVVSPVLLRTLREKFAFFTKRTYRIQAMNSTGARTSQDRPSLPNASGDFMSPQCSGHEQSSVQEPSFYVDPPNTSIVMPREYTDQEESQDPPQYTFVE